MASTFVVTANFGVSVPDAASAQEAVQIAKDMPVSLGTGMYQVEEWADSGEYIGTRTFFADGTEKPLTVVRLTE